MRRRVVTQLHGDTVSRTFRWVKWLAGAVVALVVIGFVYRDYRGSQAIRSPYRYNLVLIQEQGGVVFVSFDPEERQVFALPYPKNLEVRSRSVGIYKIENLHKLGSYEGNTGQFVKRKVQGFMRVPVAGYLMTSYEGSPKDVLKRSLMAAAISGRATSLSRIDATLLTQRLLVYDWRLADEEELVRSGVISSTGETWQYSHERLKQYLETKVFDWSVGASNTSVAVINASGMNGLGNDVAEFLSNLGFDVVNVKGSGDREVRTATTIVYKSEDERKLQGIIQLFADLFDWHDVQPGSTDEYRAQVIITLGTDALDLF